MIVGVDNALNRHETCVAGEITHQSNINHMEKEGI